jgi:hypothetical protein
MYVILYQYRTMVGTGLSAETGAYYRAIIQSGLVLDAPSTEPMADQQDWK